MRTSIASLKRNDGGEMKAVLLAIPGAMKVKFLKGLTVAGVIAAAVKVVFLLLAGQVGREVGKEVYPATSNAHDTDYYKSHSAELAAAINTNMMLPQLKTTEDGTRMRMEPVAVYGQTINYSYTLAGGTILPRNAFNIEGITGWQNRQSSNHTRIAMCLKSRR